MKNRTLARTCAAVALACGSLGYWLAPSLTETPAAPVAPATPSAPAGPAEAAWNRWLQRSRLASAAELPALAAEIALLPAGAEQTQAMRLLRARWVDTDAAAGWEFARQSGLPGARAAYLAEWTEVAPAAVAKAIRDAGGCADEELFGGLHTALEKLARMDPNAAAEFLPLLFRRVINGETRQVSSDEADAVVTQCLDTLAAKDPLEAARWFFQERDKWGERRDVHFKGASGALRRAMRDGALDAGQVMGWLTKGHSDADVAMFSRAIWTDLPPDKQRESAEWLKSAPGGKPLQTALEAVCGQWLRQDPAAARTYMASLSESAREGICRNYMMENSERNGLRLAARLANLAPADQALATRWLTYSGLEARSCADIIAAQPSPAPEAVGNLAAAWAVEQPREAIAWAEKTAGAAAAGDAIQNWATEDSWGASQWAAKLPAGPLKDRASAELARHLEKSEPDSAWNWAAAISEPALRADTLAATLKQWLKAAPEAAMAAAETLGANDPARTKLQPLLEPKSQ